MAQKKGYGEVPGMGLGMGREIFQKNSHADGIFNLGSKLAISLMDQWPL